MLTKERLATRLLSYLLSFLDDIHFIMQKPEARAMMNKALKTYVVPKIKLLGFNGSFPHFRRHKGDRYEFVSFQFYNTGGKFITECGFLNIADLQLWEKDLGFEKLNYGNTNKRLRLGSVKPVTDYWFEFNNFKSESEFKDLAESVISSLPEMEKFLQ